MSHPVGHLAVDADGLILPAGATYHGGILAATSGGVSTVTLYDGLNTGGDLIDYFYSAASQRDSRWLDNGLIIRRGLYVDLGDNVSKFTLYYQPTPQERG